MEREELRQFLQEMGGVASTAQIASYFGVNPTIVRSWACENGIPTVGNAFAFTCGSAEQFATDALDYQWEEDSDVTDEEEDDDDEGDQEDEEEPGEDDDNDGDYDCCEDDD